MGWYSRCNSPRPGSVAEVALQSGLVLGQVLASHVEGVARPPPRVTGAANPLGPVHGQIGITENLLGVNAVVVDEGDADAGRDGNLSPPEDQRDTHRRHDAGDDPVRVRGRSEVLAQDDQLVTLEAGQRVTRPEHGDQALGHGHEQLVAGPPTLAFTRRIAALQVDEEHGRRHSREAATLRCVIESLQEQHPARQPGQSVVQVGVARPLGEVLEVGAGPGVEEIGRRNVGQRLGRPQGPDGHRSGCSPVEVKSAERMIAVAQGKGEDRGQARGQRPGREDPEPVVDAQIRHGNGVTAAIRGEAGALFHLALQPLEAQGGVVGSSDVARPRTGREKGHARGADGHDVDDARDQLIKDSLNRKVRHHRPSKLAKHV